MAGRKNQSKEKSNAIIEKFHQESGAEEKYDFTNTINWATAEEVESLRRPNNDDRLQAIKDKITSPISDVEIVIPKEKKRLNIIFRNGLNLKDISNPMFGEEDKSNRKMFVEDIKKADVAENKVAVIYAGDLLGVEWEMKYLNNAKIIKQTTKNGKEVAKALFYGLTERKRALLSDINFALSQGVDVYLMNGHQEHRINQYFKIDVLQEVVNVVNSDKLHYIKGVNTVVNVAKELPSGRKIYSTIGLQTNNSVSKARTGQGAVSAARRVSGENKANIVFVTNTNTVGKKDINQYFISSQATFKNTSKGHAPEIRSNSYNVFSLNIPKPGQITLIEGGNMPVPNPLEKMVYDEYMKTKYIEQAINQNIAKKINEITQPERFVENDYVKSLQYAQSRMKKENEDDLEQC